MFLLGYLYDKVLFFLSVFEGNDKLKIAKLHAEYNLDFRGNKNYTEEYSNILHPLIEIYKIENIDTIYEIKSLIFHEQVLQKVIFLISKKFWATLHFLDVDDTVLDNAQVFQSGTLKVYGIKLAYSNKHQIVLAHLKNKRLEIIKVYPNYLRSICFLRGMQFVYRKDIGFLSI